MKAGILLAAATVLSSGAACASASDREADIATLTEKKIVIWPKLYAERDADGLDAFLGDEFVVLNPDGTKRTKADELKFLRETPPDDEESDFLYTIDDIVFPTDDMAIIYGHGDSTRETEDGEPCHHNYWSSNTLVRREGEWKAVFSHVSGVTCTPIE